MFLRKTCPCMQGALLGFTLLLELDGNNNLYIFLFFYFCFCFVFVFFVGEQEIEAMDADDILARQVEQLDKEKRELQIRLKTQEKKVKHTCSCHTSKASKGLQLLPPHPTPLTP